MQLAVRTAVDADIDHHGAGLDHIAGHKTSAANGCNQNIRVGADFFQVGRVGMADRNGCIFSQQQQGCGLAHNVGTADDHGVFAVNFGAGRFDHADAARRGAGQKAGLAGLHTAHVDRGKTVHVLFRRDGVNHGALIDLLGQRQLNQNAVYGFVGCQLCNFGQQFFLGGGFRHAQFQTLDAAFAAVLYLAAHIHLAGGVFAHQNHSQAGFDALGFQGRCFGGSFGFGCGRKGLSVNDLCTHLCIPSCGFQVQDAPKRYSPASSSGASGASAGCWGSATTFPSSIASSLSLLSSTFSASSRSNSSRRRFMAAVA